MIVLSIVDVSWCESVSDVVMSIRVVTCVCACMAAYRLPIYIYIYIYHPIQHLSLCYVSSSSSSSTPDRKTTPTKGVQHCWSTELVFVSVSAVLAIWEPKTHWPWKGEPQKGIQPRNHINVTLGHLNWLKGDLLHAPLFAAPLFEGQWYNPETPNPSSPEPEIANRQRILLSWMSRFRNRRDARRRSARRRWVGCCYRAVSSLSDKIRIGRGLISAPGEVDYLGREPSSLQCIIVHDVTCIHIYTTICTYYVCNTCVYIHVCIYIYIYMYTHTCIHIYI